MAWFDDGHVRIHFEEHGAGDPVLLLPGLFGSVDEVRSVGDALAQQYHVIAADLPGSGQSLPQPRPFTVDYYQDDARSFVALLRDRVTRPVHLVGFSDGGETELLMAAMAPDLARTVCAWGTAGSVPPEASEMLPAMAAIMDDPIEPLRGFAEYLRGSYGEANARAMVKSWATAAQAIVDRGGDIARGRAAEIVCPVLLLVGEHDAFVPLALAAEMAGLLPHGETRLVPGAGHAIQTERPDWLAETVLVFLGRH
jgi:valacyclovir hydrolase